MQGAPFGLGALTLGAPRVFDACAFPILSMLLVHPYLLAGFHSLTPHWHGSPLPNLRPAKGLLLGPSYSQQAPGIPGLTPVHPEIEPASTLHLNSLSTQAGQPQGL